MPSVSDENTSDAGNLGSHKSPSTSIVGQRDLDTDDILKQMLNSRLADLLSGRDPGMSFEDVFGEKL